MANSVDPDQTALIGAVCSGSKLFASTLNLSVMLGTADKFSRRHFSGEFFLGALRVNLYVPVHEICYLSHNASLPNLEKFSRLFVVC